MWGVQISQHTPRLKTAVPSGCRPRFCIWCGTLRIEGRGSTCICSRNRDAPFCPTPHGRPAFVDEPQPLPVAVPPPCRCFRSTTRSGRRQGHAKRPRRQGILFCEPVEPSRSQDVPSIPVRADRRAASLEFFVEISFFSGSVRIAVFRSCNSNP